MLDFYEAEYYRVIQDVLPKARQDANLRSWQMPKPEQIVPENLEGCCAELNELLKYQPVYYQKDQSGPGGSTTVYWRAPRGDLGFLRNIQARGPRPSSGVSVNFANLDNPPTFFERLSAKSGVRPTRLLAKR